MLGPLFIVLGAAALLAAIIAIWQSARTLFAPPPPFLEMALGGDDRATLLAQKAAVLRSLKDLELDRSTGKVSEEDYAKLEAAHRARAKDLLRALAAETSPFQSEAEKLVDGAIGKTPKVGVDDEKDEKKEEKPEAEAEAEKKPEAEAKEEPEADAKKEPEPEAKKEPVVAGPAKCPKCQTVNDADATFCKKCATRLREEDAS